MNQEEKNSPKEIAKRLEMVLLKLGLQKTKVGSEIGANKDSFGRALRSGMVSKTILVGLSTKYKVNPVWLMEGEGNMLITDSLGASQTTESEWKDKYIACLEEKTKLQNQIIELKSRINPQ